MARAAATGDTGFLRGVASARRRRRSVQASRAREAPLRRISDRDAFAAIMAQIDGL